MATHLTSRASPVHPLLTILILFFAFITLSTTTEAASTVRTIIPTPGFNTIEVPVYSFNLTVTNDTNSILNGPIDYHPAMGGTALPLSNRTDFLLTMNIMLPHSADDISGCGGKFHSVNEFNQSFAGAWILLMASSCSYTTNIMASYSGAAGILVYGCPAEKPYSCETKLKEVTMVLPCSKPVIGISTADGDKIVAYLQAAKANGAPPLNALTMTIKSTGPLVQSERDALIAIMQQTTMGPMVSATTPQTLPYWTLARFQDMTLDPCRNRVKGIWCEGGHITSIMIVYHSWHLNNGTTTLPAEFAALTQLRYFNIYANLFTGDIPDAWCSLSEVRALWAGQAPPAGIWSLPSCIGQMTKLEELRFEVAYVRSLPDSITQLVNLRRFYARANLLTTIPSLVNLTRLEAFEVSQNQLTSFPILPPGAPLIIFGLGTNQISGTIPTSYFDGMTNLQYVDLNTNQFYGPLPNFDGCTNMLVMDLGSQLNANGTGGFNGSMPSSWSAMKSITQLYLQENSLVAPMYCSNMIALETLDLSHNQLSAPTGSGVASTDNQFFLNSLTSPSIISLRLSYNRINGPLGTAIFETTYSTREVYLDHNQITLPPATLFSGYAMYTIVDLSYNNLSVPSTWVWQPPKSSTLTFNLRGNPYLTVATLPSWVIIGSSSIKEPDTSFTCFQLKATTAPDISFQIDASFNSYQHCRCDSGYFGQPPLCGSLPYSASLSPHRLITSDDYIGDQFAAIIESANGMASHLEITGTNSSTTLPSYLQAFSDDMYGENRLTLGISTVWTADLTNEYADDPDAYATAGLSVPSPIQTHTIIDGTSVSPSNLWTPVRVTTIRLHVSADEFTTFDDTLSVYEGDSDLKGNRIIAIRGNEVKPTVSSSPYTLTTEYQLLHGASIAKLTDPRLYEIQVFSPMASVQFTSREADGMHFYGTYSYDFVCPSGYFYDTTLTPSQCRTNLDQFHVGTEIRSAVFAVGSLAIIGIVVNIVILVWHWESLVYKAASRIFMLVILVLLLFMGLGSLLYAAIPHDHDSVGSAICYGRAWLTCLPLAGILGILLAKTNRLNTIFGATTLQVKKMTDMDIAKTVLLVCAVQIVLLGVFTGQPLSRSQLAVGKGNLSDQLVLSCSEERGFMAWMGVQIAFICCLMFPAAYLGYKTRNLPSQYNESSHIQNAIVLLIFFGIIIVPLDIFIQDNPEAAVLIQGLGQAFLCLMMTAIIFGPKLYYLTQTVTRGAVGGTAAKTQLGTTVTSTSGDERVVGLGRHMKEVQMAAVGNSPRPLPVANFPSANTIAAGGHIQSQSNKHQQRTPSATALTPTLTTISTMEHMDTPTVLSPPTVITPVTLNHTTTVEPPLSPTSTTKVQLVDASTTPSIQLTPTTNAEIDAPPVVIPSPAASLSLGGVSPMSLTPVILNESTESDLAAPTGSRRVVKLHIKKSSTNVTG